jgi:predicted transcriptional regulator
MRQKETTNFLYYKLASKEKKRKPILTGCNLDYNSFKGVSKCNAVKIGLGSFTIFPIPLRPIAIKTNTSYKTVEKEIKSLTKPLNQLYL